MVRKEKILEERKKLGNESWRKKNLNEFEENKNSKK